MSGQTDVVRTLREASRQLAIYRKFVNNIDDAVEYSREVITRAEIHRMLADLTAQLANKEDA